MRTSTRSPQVAVVAHQYWPVPGPATLRLGKLVEQLTTVLDDPRVQVFTTRDPKSTGRSTIAGPNGEMIVQLKSNDATGQSIKRIYLLFRFAFEAFWNIYRMKSVNLVVCDPPPVSGLAAILAAKRRKAVSVYYFCDSWASVSTRGGIAGRVAKMIKIIEDACLRRADIVIASESTLEAEAVRRGSSNVILAQNGANIELISSIEDESDQVFEPERPYFVYAGTHSEVHGARVFVEAARKLWSDGADFNLRFIGSGTDAAWVASQVPSSGGRLSHEDAVALADLVPVLQGASAALVSLGEVPEDYYATPSKIYTSLAVGCPVIYAGVRAPVSFIDDYALGWLVPQDIVSVSQAMSDCLNRFQGSDSRNDSLAERCREYAYANRDFTANLQQASLSIKEQIESGAHK